MFNALTGTLVQKGLDVIHVELMGIEWEIYMALRFIAELGEPGTTIRVLVWLLHKEDSMRLYGFPTEQDRKLFLELIKVSGIGPKQALKILSGIRTEDFQAVLAQGDSGRLEKIPGIGKKTAQNILLNLQGVLSLRVTSNDTVQSAQYNEIIAALADLGYDKKRCTEVIEKLLIDTEFDKIAPEAQEQWLFHKALIMLSTG
ncbi:MAG TPA: Holliday junction branch migration protein RuvA [Spirochaetales bacterium]|nr:Holliday junction branch migration protein RuvA [Spirochaetales bacterium]